MCGRSLFHQKSFFYNHLLYTSVYLLYIPVKIKDKTTIESAQKIQISANFRVGTRDIDMVWLQTHEEQSYQDTYLAKEQI